jgi:hypothetical protein
VAALVSILGSAAGVEEGGGGGAAACPAPADLLLSRLTARVAALRPSRSSRS